MADEPRFRITLQQIENFEFNVKFDWEGVEDLLLDEPDPLGGQKGPNAARLVGAAAGNCLSASLLFCLQKAKVDIKGIKTVVEGEVVRNEKKRLRIGKLKVTVGLDTEAERAKLERCFGLFEDYCLVTQSLRDGIPVHVSVVDRNGETLFENEA